MTHLRHQIVSELYHNQVTVGIEIRCACRPSITSLRFCPCFHIFMYETTRSTAREEQVVATPDLASLASKAKSIRKAIIASTTAAGSGHPTSSMSAVEIAVALYFGGVLRHD